MKICMVGTGYVGLVSGACFADLGNSVWCVDKNKERIDLLNTNQVRLIMSNLQQSSSDLIICIREVPAFTSGGPEIF